MTTLIMVFVGFYLAALPFGLLLTYFMMPDHVNFLTKQFWQKKRNDWQRTGENMITPYRPGPVSQKIMDRQARREVSFKNRINETVGLFITL